MRFSLFLLLTLSGWAQTPDEILASVARVHGAPGIFAVAGYREGQRALKELGPSLRVVHHCPLKVQYSCVADGWQAATGVSAGKLSLRVEEGEEVETQVEDSKSGSTLRFMLRPEFIQRFLNTPYSEQAAAARQVLEMPDDQIFTISP